MPRALSKMRTDVTATTSCPAWQVRQVVSHLDGIEEALAQWRPSGDTPAPFEIVGEVFDEVHDWPPDRLFTRFRAVLAGRRAELLVADPGLFDEVSWTPVGVQTYGRRPARFELVAGHQPISAPGSSSAPTRRRRFATCARLGCNAASASQSRPVG